ncbi:MAG: hypothetical protein ACP5QO_15680, partial [Clostridia bacterium]
GPDPPRHVRRGRFPKPSVGALASPVNTAPAEMAQTRRRTLRAAVARVHRSTPGMEAAVSR